MKNTLFSLAFILFGWFLPSIVNAQAVITEIMYDVEGTDTGREWIEIKNIGSEEIDLSAWKFYEANTNHKITAMGSSILSPGGFALLVDDPAKFKTDNPIFSGLIFDSVFSLGNTGETVVLRDQNAADIDTVTYSSESGANGDGNSLQKTAAGTWVSAAPTLGEDTVATISENPSQENEKHEDKDDSPQTVDSSYSSHQSQSTIFSSYEEPELAITSGRSRLGYVGVPIEFEAKLKKAKNVSMGNSITSVWSMGDGSQMSGQFISHTYEFPGEYNVIVNSDNGGVHAVSKSKVKIVEPKVLIKSVDEKGIEITNLDSSELNIGGFVLTTKDKRFVIPADTIISAKSTIKIPLAATKFRELEEYVDIQTPRGLTLSRIEVKSDSSNTTDQVRGDTPVVLPEGMTLNTFREKLVNALAIQESVKNSRVPIAEVVQKNRQEFAAGASATGTPFQVASVIYTEIPLHEVSWWSRIKSIFGK
jgi:hypothetical protein